VNTELEVWDLFFMYIHKERETRYCNFSRNCMQFFHILYEIWINFNNLKLPCSEPYGVDFFFAASGFQAISKCIWFIVKPAKWFARNIHHTVSSNSK
jgi:glyoxylate carboligase